jgi:predicted RNA-binding Zn ribbon-like protein
MHRQSDDKMTKPGSTSGDRATDAARGAQGDTRGAVPVDMRRPGRTDGTDAGAGHLFLSFVNTVADDGPTRRTDTFADGRALLAQLVAAGLADPPEAPGAGQMRSLLTLREAAYGLLSAVAAGRRPAHEDRLVVETAIKSAMADATLHLDGRTVTWRPGPMGGLHDHLALALADLLGSADLGRLRECRGCTRLFLDHGRGPGRRWCSMTRCGNRAKARGFRARRRART